METGVDQLSKLVTKNETRTLHTEDQVSCASSELETLRKTIDRQTQDVDQLRSGLEEKFISLSKDLQHTQSARDLAVDNMSSRLSASMCKTEELLVDCVRSEALAQFDERLSDLTQRSQDMQSQVEDVTQTVTGHYEASQSAHRDLIDEIVSMKDRVKDVTLTVTKHHKAAEPTHRNLIDEITNMKDLTASAVPVTSFAGISGRISDITSALEAQTAMTEEFHKMLSQQQRLIHDLSAKLTEQATHNKDIEKSMETICRQASSTKKALEETIDTLRREAVTTKTTLEENMTSMRREASSTTRDLEQSLQNLRVDLGKQKLLHNASKKRSDSLQHEVTTMKSQHEENLHVLEAKLTKLADMPASIPSVHDATETADTTASSRKKPTRAPAATQSWLQWLSGKQPSDTDAERTLSGELFSLGDVVDAGFAEPDEQTRKT